MKKINLIKKVLGVAVIGLLFFANAGLSQAVNITVPAAPGSGYGLVSTTTGAYIATTTGVVTCSGSATCGSGSYVFGNALNISATGGGGGGSGTVGTSTNETQGFLPYWTTTSATPALLGKVATSSIGAGTGLTFSGTPGAQVGGTNGTYSVNTSQNITTLSNLSTAGTLNNTSAGVLYSTGTSTPGTSAPIGYSGTLGQFIGGVSGNFTCTSASAGVTGCLTGTDWSTFNGKQAAGNYITALTGDVTASGPGSVAATIAANHVTLADIVQIGANTVLVNNTSATANVVAIATSTFFGTGTPGQVLMWSGSTPIWAATSTSAGGGSAFPFTPTNNFGINTNATSTTVSFFAGLFASSTSRIASTTFAIGGNVGIGSSTPLAPFSMFPVINPLFNNLVQSSSSIYSSAGTYTWVPPAGAAFVIVQAWGGGGGGGGDQSGQGRGGGGGGAGAYVASTTVTLSPFTTSVTLIVGGGGGGGSNATGGAGGTGFGAGAAGVSNNSSGGGGGGSSAFGSSVIACGGGGGGGEDSVGNNSGNPGSGATGSSGGAGGATSGTAGGAGGGGGCNTAGSGATGGTGGTTQTGTNGSGGTIAGVGSGGGGSSAGVTGNGTNGTGLSGGGAGGVGSGGAAAGANGVGPDSGGGGNGGGSGSVGGAGGMPGAGGGGSQNTASVTGGGGGGMVIITTFSYTNSFTPLFAQMFSTQEPVLVGGVSQFGSTTIGVGTSTPQATFDIYSSSNTFGAFMVHIVQSGVRYVAEKIDSVGHLITGGKAPTCGTGCTSVTGDDRSMRIVTGSSVSSATVNFANTYTTTPVCIANEESAGIISVDASSTPTTVIVDFASSLTSVRVAVICQISANFTF